MTALLNGPFGRISLSTTPFTIGRLPDNQLTLGDPMASAHHAEIHQDGTSYTLTDLGSTSGTFVNEEPLIPNEPRLLHAGDVIRVGDTRFTYEAEDNASVEPTVYVGQTDATPQPASVNTAYGMGMSGVANVTPSGGASNASQETREEHQEQSSVPYVPSVPSTPPGQNGPTPSNPSMPYQGQYPQPFPQQPFYGQPVPPGYAQPQVYGQVVPPGYPQPPLYGQPGYPQQPVYGQPGQIMPPGYPQPPMYGQPGPGYQVPPYGVVPGAVPTTATKANRNRTITILAIIAAVVVLAAIFGGIAYAQRSTPEKTLTTFCSDLQSGNYSDAYSQLSARIRESETEASFDSAIKQTLSSGGGLKDCTIGSVSDDGSVGRGVMTWIPNNGQGSAVFDTTLINENGVWKIDGLSAQQ